MKAALFPFVVLCALLLLAAGFVDADAAPPNVVLIISDDQGWTDYGFMEHPHVQTPNLDKLAEQSLVFERGYVASPLCRPSLASMATGRFPFGHRITGNDVDGLNKRAELDKPVQVAFNQLPSFIRELSHRGYLTHQSGKWWEGSFRDGGFTHGMTHGDPKRDGRHGDAGLSIGRNGLAPITDFIDLAVENEKPFFVWYAPFLPHTPHNPPTEILQHYLDLGLKEDVAKYYAMCEWFDQTCGKLLSHIENHGLRRNTLVIYICDNGWAATSTNIDDPNQSLWKRYALRSKGSPYEMGIRSPIMISWLGQVEPAHSPELAHAIDLFPTIAAATGIPAPKDLPGINLLNPKAPADRNAVFGVCNSIHNMNPKIPDETLQYLWCVSGDWKLLLRYPGKDTTSYKKVHSWDQRPVQLYNLQQDPHEECEVSAKHPKIVENLRKKIEAWHSLKPQ